MLRLEKRVQILQNRCLYFRQMPDSLNLAEKVGAMEMEATELYEAYHPVVGPLPEAESAALEHRVSALEAWLDR
jgi:hypothetical protein